MTSVEDLYKRYQFSPKINEQKDLDAAIAWFKKEATNSIVELEDKTGYKTQFKEEFIRHAVEDHKKEHREKYIGNFKEVFTNADEIWSVINKGKLERVYIKYYQDFPLMILVDVDSSTPYSMVELTRIENGKKVLNDVQIINKRSNQLLYRQ
jgi:hypothetical protein